MRHSETQDFKSRRTSKNVLDIRFSTVLLAVATGHTDVVVAGIAVTVLVLNAPLGVSGGARIGTFFTQQCGTWTTAINTLKKKTAYTKEVSAISSTTVDTSTRVPTPTKVQHVQFKPHANALELTVSPRSASNAPPVQNSSGFDKRHFPKPASSVSMLQ